MYIHKIKYLVAIVLTGLLSHAMAFELSSQAFKANQNIPREYTCQGVDVSPELSWTDVPHGTEALALTMYDPDGRNGQGVTHWIAYNIPADITNLPRATDTLSQFATVIKNSKGNARYDGPCPPSGKHRYVFTIYALKAPIDRLRSLMSNEQVTEIERLSFDHAQLIGLYQKTDGIE